MNHIIPFLHEAETLLFHFGEVAILFFEFFSMILIIQAGAKGLIHIFRKDVDESILQGFSTGLTFLLGAEILKTMILQDTTDLLIVGGIILMRVAITVLIHWEMKFSEHEENKARH